MTSPARPGAGNGRSARPGRHTTADEARRLPCGHDPIEVAEHARAGRASTHERDCPHCQTLVAADQLTRRAAERLTAADEDLTVPETLLPAVMRTVWAEVRRGAEIPLDLKQGSAAVSDRAVAALLTSKLDDLPGLVVHSCQVQLTEPPDPNEAADRRDTPGQITVAVAAAGQYNADLLELAATARRLIHRVLDDQLALSARSVDVDIVDVFVPEMPR